MDCTSVAAEPFGFGKPLGLFEQGLYFVLFGRVQQHLTTNYIRQMILNLMGHNDGSLLELVGDA
jgi:hypothetical protein